MLYNYSEIISAENYETVISQDVLKKIKTLFYD